MIVPACLCAALFGAFQQSPPSNPKPDKPAPSSPSQPPVKPTTDPNAKPAPAPITPAQPAPPGKQEVTPGSAKPAEPAPAKPALAAPTGPLVQILPDTVVKGVSADPNPYIPGQVVTFSWPAGASHVVISGGDLKKPITLKNQSYFTVPTPAPVTEAPAPQKTASPSAKTASSRTAKAVRGKAAMTKTPTPATVAAKPAKPAPLPKPAQYIFELWYPDTDKPETQTPSAPAPAPDAASGKTPTTAPMPQPATQGKGVEKPAMAATPKPPEPKSATQNPTTQKPPESKGTGKKEDVSAKTTAPPAVNERHERYKLTIAAQKGEYPKFTTYRDKYPWRLDYVAGWKSFPVANLEGGHTLVYLEPREDSPIRMAVASWPVGEMPTARLMQMTMQEGVSQYDVLESVQQKQTTQAGEAATWLTFQGVDSALPGVKTFSTVVTLVHKNRGFVISARTPVSKRGDMEILLARLVRSFAFAPAPPPATVPTPEPKTSKGRRTRETHRRIEKKAA